MRSRESSRFHGRNLVINTTSFPSPVEAHRPGPQGLRPSARNATLGIDVVQRSVLVLLMRLRSCGACRGHLPPRRGELVHGLTVLSSALLRQIRPLIARSVLGASRRLRHSWFLSAISHPNPCRATN